jgi:hypothetical protein
MQIGAAHAAATHPNSDLSRTRLSRIALDPAQGSGVNRRGVVDNPSFHGSIIPADAMG